MTTKHILLQWSPRILGIAVALFLGLFALDAFQPGRPLARALADFAMHLLPAAMVLAIVVLAWHRPWVGGVSFVLLAAAYALTARYRIEWIVAISGPLLIVGVLYLWSGGTEILDRSEAESFNSQPPTPNSQKASRSYLLG
jgi:hypothetical protein